MNSSEYEKVLEEVKAEIMKLAESKDDVTKEVFTTLTGFLEDLNEFRVSYSELEEQVATNVIKPDVKPTEAKTEEVKDEPKAEEPVKVEEPKTEDNPEVKVEEPKAEPKADIPEEAKNPEDIVSLSKDVSDKLQESVIELSKMESEISTKEDIITAQGNKIIELQNKLDKYEEVERIELSRIHTNKVTTLIELYNSLGIEKGVDEIEASYDDSQIDKLIVDLSLINKPATTVASKAVRQTAVNSRLEFSKQKDNNKDMTAEEQLDGLFGF